MDSGNSFYVKTWRARTCESYFVSFVCCCVCGYCVRALCCFGLCVGGENNGKIASHYLSIVWHCNVDMLESD